MFSAAALLAFGKWNWCVFLVYESNEIPCLFVQMPKTDSIMP
jgi:hypothetical protein